VITTRVVAVKHGQILHSSTRNCNLVNDDHKAQSIYWLTFMVYHRKWRHYWQHTHSARAGIVVTRMLYWIQMPLVWIKYSLPSLLAPPAATAHNNTLIASSKYLLVGLITTFSHFAHLIVLYTRYAAYAVQALPKPGGVVGIGDVLLAVVPKVVPPE